MNSPYRTNQNTAKHEKEEWFKDRPVKNYECMVDDVVAKFHYTDVDGSVKHFLIEFSGTASYDSSDIREVNSPDYHFKNGTAYYHTKIEHAAKNGYLWIGDHTCIPWSRVLKAEVINRTERKATMRYISA